MRRSLLIAVLVVAVTAGALVLAGLIPHGPDITRERVEVDLAAVWPNQYAQLARLQGKPATAVPAEGVSCDKGGPGVPDRGPGRNWVCTFTYTAGGRTHSARYEMIVRGEACYTATDPALIESPTVVDPATGSSVPNPLYQFDGCFDVYDGRTSTTR